MSVLILLVRILVLSTSDVASDSLKPTSFQSLSIYSNFYATVFFQLSNLTYGHSKGVIYITNDTNWAGFKSSDQYRADISVSAATFSVHRSFLFFISPSLQYPMALLVIIILNMVVHYHQRLWYRRRGREPLPSGIIFDQVNLHDAQKNMVDFTKFVVNHGFYKLGLEVRRRACPLLLSRVPRALMIALMRC